MEIVKNSTILVTVEDVANDVIVVSYSCSKGLFQGVLMNSNKKILPCGITLPQNVMSPSTDLDEDKLFSVSQRFTYFQDKLFTAAQRFQKPSKKSKVIGKNHMTVRLRPRQVLCSKCKGICNENSENVDHSKRKEISNVERRLSHPGEKSPRPLFSENQQDNQPKINMQPVVMIESKSLAFVPSAPVCNIAPTRVTRLRFGNINSGKVTSKLIGPSSKYWLRPSSKSPISSPTTTPDPTPHVPPLTVNITKCKVEPEPISAEEKCQTPRSEQDESATEPEEAPTAESQSPSFSEEPEQGAQSFFEENSIPEEFSEEKKMVLRKKRSVGSMEDLWDESVFGDSQKKAVRTTPVIKISFGSQGEETVLKIPSKVPNYNPSESEAEERSIRKAMKKAKKEAKRKLSLSPLPTGESYKKHRRKEKHKKKHRSDDNWQKLSINLKRLNDEYGTTKKDDDEKDESSSSSSSSEEESPPDFPPTQSSCTSDKALSSCVMSDGNNLSIGDIVWGKVHGFPWWPGKILSISMTDVSEDTTEAHVSWFGSSTSSRMPCNQLCPFLDFFKLRYNKKKKSSCYKEAIRQAIEARKKKDDNVDVIV